MKIILTIVTFLWGTYGFSEDLFPDQCVYTDGDVTANVVMSKTLEVNIATSNIVMAYNGALGLTCQELKTLQDGLVYTSIALLPVSALIASNPELQAALSIKALTLGLSNPIVASIAVVGGTGAAVVFILLKDANETCERLGREEYERQLFINIENKLKMSPANSGVHIDFNK